LVGADLIVLTKSDLVEPERTVSVTQWLAGVSQAPVIDAPNGEVSSDVVLGAQIASATAPNPAVLEAADHRYERWAWRPIGPVDPSSLDAFLAELPHGLLRLKGVVEVSTEAGVVARLVHVVGTTISSTVIADVGFVGLEAIGIRGVFDVARIEQSALKYLLPA